MLGEELGNLGFHSLGQKGARPATQDFGELVGEHPWLNELDDGIFGHGVSSFGGEVAGLVTAAIRLLHSSTPSPTSAHSSHAFGRELTRYAGLAFWACTPLMLRQFN